MDVSLERQPVRPITRGSHDICCQIWDIQTITTASMAGDGGKWDFITRSDTDTDHIGIKIYVTRKL